MQTSHVILDTLFYIYKLASQLLGLQGNLNRLLEHGKIKNNNILDSFVKSYVIFSYHELTYLLKVCAGY